MNTTVLFEEKQYLGQNNQSILRRTTLALFCFIAYYWSENPKPVDVSGLHIGSYPGQNIENSGQLFFIMGVIILLFSIALIFIIHIHTIITKEGITLTGLWTSRKIFIKFSDIVSARKVRYRKSSLGRSVYNLHSKGKIRFHTRGNELVELIDKTGIKYRIGSQRASE
ncbi:MAG: hypothetical protein IT235_00500, partial [Bacteroidia bacterium]|nr:hypothetical protein [Bacteroidia bacterium]